MRTAAIWVLTVAAALPAIGQTKEEEFGTAVKRSLDRSRLLYPESAKPDSALSKAILARIEWLQYHNRKIFADPNWPLRVTATEAAALGIPLQRNPQTGLTPSTGTRILAVVMRNFSTTEASFRKDQQIILESIQDYGKRGITIVDGEPVLLWLDNIKLLRELSPQEALPIVVKVEAARYGVPGESIHSVTAMVQSLISPDASGRYEILVSDALLTPVAARKLNRAARIVTDRLTGESAVDKPERVLTVTYTLNGSTKTKQARAGERLVLD
ncbi:MAG TPA: hypothetical protein VIT23_03130 [Terrimicrobiaceae bacterium]